MTLGGIFLAYDASCGINPFYRSLRSGAGRERTPDKRESEVELLDGPLVMMRCPRGARINSSIAHSRGNASTCKALKPRSIRTTCHRAV
jgi:hypothetical protein